MRSTFFAAVLAARLSHQAAVPAPADNSLLPPLTFKEDGTFQVCVFADLHFAMYEWLERGGREDEKTLQVMTSILDKEKPDFVVLNGDIINGDSTRLHNSTKHIDRIVAPMVGRGLTWGSTYGNHDHQLNLDGDALLEREQSWLGARTQKHVFGDSAGTTNYYVPVYPEGCTDEEACVPELIMWFFDSRGGYLFQKKDKNGNRIFHESWVAPEVADWFQQTNAELVSKYQKHIPSLGFVHITIKATTEVQSHKGIDPRRQPGINDEGPVSPQSEGWCRDGHYDYKDPACHYGGQDLRFMQALADTPGMIGLFSGHNHGATWCQRWTELIPGMTVAAPRSGMNLCFGQHTGYGGYGNWIRGARQIVVSKEKLRQSEIETWIRLESGDVVGSMSLNKTYGQDTYPETPNQMTYLGKK